MTPGSVFARAPRDDTPGGAGTDLVRADDAAFAEARRQSLTIGPTFDRARPRVRTSRTLAAQSCHINFFWTRFPRRNERDWRDGRAPRQYRPRVDASRLRTPRVARVRLFRLFPFDTAMPTSVSRPSIWRPAGSSDSLVDAGAEADATSERAAGASTVGGPDSPPNSPLPKRLRVRLEASKEKHSAHAHLERRLRLAERIQVRARGNPRFQGFSPDNAFPFASGARGADARALAAEATLSPPDPHPSRGTRPLPDSTTRARPRTRPVPNVVAPASWSEPPESGRVVTHPATSAPGFFLRRRRNTEQLIRSDSSLRGSSLRRDRRVSRLHLLHDPALRGIHAILNVPISCHSPFPSSSGGRHRARPRASPRGEPPRRSRLRRASRARAPVGIPPRASSRHRRRESPCADAPPRRNRRAAHARVARRSIRGDARGDEGTTRVATLRVGIVRVGIPIARA